MSVALSPETVVRVDALFSGADREVAEWLLVDRCGNNLPFHEDADATSLERVRFAALKLGGGDLEALRAAVDLANLDWRDLLVAAGFANDVHAHRSWSPDGPAS